MRSIYCTKIDDDDDLYVESSREMDMHAHTRLDNVRTLFYEGSVFFVCYERRALFRASLDWEPKFFGSDVSEVCREGFLETNKKTNYIPRQETARQIY